MLCEHGQHKTAVGQGFGHFTMSHQTLMSYVAKLSETVVGHNTDHAPYVAFTLNHPYTEQKYAGGDNAICPLVIASAYHSTHATHPMCMSPRSSISFFRYLLRLYLPAIRHLLRTILSLILTNSEARKLLPDFSLIGRDLLARGASKAADAEVRFHFLFPSFLA